MRWHTMRALPALFCLAPAALAVAPSSIALDLQPASRLWISGSSTVRSFECKATAFDANVESTPGAVTAVLAGTRAVSAVEIRVPADRLDCSNGTMNEHMLKALKAKANPSIVFKLASYDLAKESNAIRVALSGTLTLGGVEKPVAISATATEGPTGALHVAGTHEIRMTEWGLKPPSLMLGTMKVDEHIKVGFDLLLKE
jgi:polyisoprenoid-binding protein YceI